MFYPWLASRLTEMQSPLQPTVIRAAGGVVDHGIALFFYGIFPEALQRFEDGKVKLHYIATWRNVLAVAREQKLFDEKTLSEVEAFLDALNNHDDVQNMYVGLAG